MSTTTKRKILFIAPTKSDESQFNTVSDTFEIVPYISFQPKDISSLNLRAFFEEVIAFANESTQPFDGIAATHDFPACLLAAMVGKRLNLEFIPDIKSLLRAQHKVIARSLQEKTLSKYLPSWSRLNLGAEPSLAFPFFIRPSRANTSAFAQKISCTEELAAYLEKAQSYLEDYSSLFDKMWELEIGDGESAKCFLIEELVEDAVQVTVDGFTFDGVATAVGVTDSIMFPGTISFQRFDYPSHLPANAVTLMKRVAKQTAMACQLDNTMWNVEFFYHPISGKCSIIEINSRMSPQFSDLYEMVDGVNLYQIQFQIACGIKPNWKERQGQYRVATSYVLRAFQDLRIKKMPAAETIAALTNEYPLLRIVFFGALKEGLMISEASTNDMASFRYGIINMGAQNWQNLDKRIVACKKKMGLIFYNLKIHPNFTRHYHLD